VTHDVVLDIGDEDRIVGIEILNASRNVDPGQFRSMKVQIVD